MSFFCFEQKTAYEMRISDWRSDVCSSDLQQSVPCPCLALRPPAPDDLTLRPGQRVLPYPEKQGIGQQIACPYPLLIYGIFYQCLATQTCCSSFRARKLCRISDIPQFGTRHAKQRTSRHDTEIDRASGRERVCQYVEISGV